MLYTYVYYVYITKVKFPVSYSLHTVLEIMLFLMFFKAGPALLLCYTKIKYNQWSVLLMYSIIYVSNINHWGFHSCFSLIPLQVHFHNGNINTFKALTL
jgi:hypothetical protein